MTRFARAKGSKASNERVPESATPWNIMKEEMQRAQQEKQDNKERQKIDKIRQENYNKFLKEQKSDVKNEWADFSDSEKSSKKDIKTGKGVEKAKIRKEKKAKISKEDVREMLRPDPEIDGQVEKLTTKIDKILKKEKLKKNKSNEQSEIQIETEEKTPKKQKKIKKESGASQPLDDDAPIEVSAKTEVPRTPIVKSKQKIKKTPLKIEINKPSENNHKSPTNSEKIENTKNSTEDNSKTVTNENGEPQKLTKSMKKRMMKKKKLEAQKLLNPKPENGETEVKNDSKKQKKKQKQKKPAPDVENSNPDAENNDSNKNFNENNRERFDNRKRKTSTADYEKPNKFPRKQQKMKVAKVRDNLEHKRRKPDMGSIKMNINGLEFEIVKFDGFPVKKEDADRLHDLRRQMISKGIPRSEVKRTLQLERRKAEKALTREKKKVCFQCRKAGHVLSECPDLNNEVSTTGTGICFKCGSTEHTHFECKVTRGDEFKFASCFICREQGHIARQCPDNPKGLYPQGGACRICGDVTHLKKDCPQLQQEKEDNASFLQTISGGNLELDEDASNKIDTKPAPIKNKIVKF